MMGTNTTEPRAIRKPSGIDNTGHVIYTNVLHNSFQIKLNIVWYKTIGPLHIANGHKRNWVIVPKNLSVSDSHVC